MGSGKSSTVFASVPEVVTEEVAAYSIEDPVEFELPGVTQYEISARNLAHRAELMTRTLHDIRRQDANVVIVGEIRDRQSMELAFDLATSGIRVLATVHAASALHTVQRLLQWELDPFVVATTLRGVLNMRLLQRLCADCRVPVTWADGPHLWPRSIFGRPLPEQGWAVNPRGCADCDGTGTRGQFPIAEFLSLAGTGVTALHHPEGVARLGGAMRLLEDEAVDALAGGTTSVAAVRRAQVGTTAELVTAEVPGNPLLGAEVTEEVYA
jgi:type II secretory ATPase GspE/PulE/Tfp pilus assembly ATPase PilB-like protein